MLPPAPEFLFRARFLFKTKKSLNFKKKCHHHAPIGASATLCRPALEASASRTGSRTRARSVRERVGVPLAFLLCCCRVPSRVTSPRRPGRRPLAGGSSRGSARGPRSRRGLRSGGGRWKHQSVVSGTKDGTKERREHTDTNGSSRSRPSP